MKWEESTAKKCRYGEEVGEAFGSPLVLWERSLSDYQGYASFVGWDGARIIYYHWNYGSCSGCDTWESSGLADNKDKLVLTIRGQGEYFEDAEVLRKFFYPIFLSADRDEQASLPQGGQGAWGKYEKPSPIQNIKTNIPFDDLIESARLYLAEARQDDPQG
jgi:hypothetical protein